MTPKVEIYRLNQNKNQTSGICIVSDENGSPLFTALSLERGWRNNEQNISCVPTGKYKIVYESSNRFKRHLWELKDVPNRSECKFHSANYWYQLNGCISLGLTFKDINKDGYRDLTDSVNTMKAFHSVLFNFTELELYIY